VFTLREYRPDDFERLMEIDRACFIPGIAYSDREMDYFLNRPLAVRIVAEHNGGDIQGFIIAERLRSRRAQNPIGRIITIDILPQSRRSGLGTRLLNAAEERLREAGCSYVSLETAVDNLGAMHFYKKHGYTGLKILRNYYLDSIDALLMGKKL
jgi:ribosomal-protein-alanine N-acetyltransferase